MTEIADPIVARAQAGDRTAFRELFIRHREEVARTVFRVLGPSSDVEDVVQEVFIHLYRSIGSFRGDSKFQTWLYRIALNVARMHIRKVRARPQAATYEVPDRADESVGSSPHESSAREERVRALHRAIGLLSEKKQTVLVLHDIEGVSAERIAEIVEAPVLTVRTRLFYARKELQEQMRNEPTLCEVVDEMRDERERAICGSGTHAVGDKLQPDTDDHVAHPRRGARGGPGGNFGGAEGE